MSRLRAHLFVWLQYLVPRFTLTALFYRVARIRRPFVKNLVIRGFVRLFDVDTDEADAVVPDGYGTFNEFFTRALKPGSREIDPAPGSLVSPADGSVSEAGTIERGRLLQAKGIRYSLDDLLATDLDEATDYDGGRFVTIYLAPHNYHRVHAPLAGTLTALRYVPGDLFSVNDATAQVLPGLFARNERLVCHFRTAAGPLALIFIGAMNVGSITTPWSGEIRPRRHGVVQSLDLARSREPVELDKGGLLGWFNMGSSVIVLLPRGAGELRDDLERGRPVRVGEPLATLPALAT